MVEIVRLYHLPLSWFTMSRDSGVDLPPHMLAG
jgi:hypothetical protein